MESHIEFPIYVELKSYAGNLWNLVQDVLPIGIELQELINQGGITILLDGANEVESKYFESDLFAEDLAAFARRVEGIPLVVTSRSDVGLGQTQFMRCVLDHVDLEHVKKLFETNNVALITLLQKPLFLKLAQETSFDGKDGSLPQDLYLAYFKAIQCRLETDLQVSIDLVPVLAGMAFELINEGRQTFMAAPFVQLIDDVTDSRISPTSIINWMIERDFITPLPGAKLSFAHHTISEYLAAYHVAQIHKVSRDIVRRCLGRRSWDVAILLTLGFLDAADSAQLFTQILHADPSSALTALDYIEMNRGELMVQCLSYIESLGKLSFEEEHRLSAAIERVRPEAECIDSLWRICRSCGLIGGAASTLLVQFANESDIDDVADTLFEIALEARDYNFSSKVSRALRSRVSSGWKKQIIATISQIDVPEELAATWRHGGEEDHDSYISIAVFGEHLLETSTPSEILEIIETINTRNVIVEDIVMYAVSGNASFEAMILVSQLIEAGNLSGIFKLYMQVHFHSPAVLDLDRIYSEKLVERICELMKSECGSAQWAIKLLYDLCRHSENWRCAILAMPVQQTDLQNLVLLHVTGDRASFDAKIETFVEGRSLTRIDAELLTACFENWSGYEGLMLQLLRTRNFELAERVLDFHGHDCDDLNITINGEDVDWWVDWLCESTMLQRSVLPYRLGAFIAAYTDVDAIAIVKRRFNVGDDITRRVLSQFVLNLDGVLKFEELTTDSLSWLVAAMERSQVTPWGPTLLGVVATEEFAQSSLVPLLKGNISPTFRQNLKRVLDECGRRHGRRYATTDDKVIG